ncbi:MAG: cytochrome C oxidase subunit IV family protein [Alphaproteobacteria bacterium]
MSSSHGSAPAAPHAAPHSAEEVAAEVRTYLTIFGALAVLTLLTVGVAYMNLPHAAGVVVALVIAALKVFLIATFFMHLRAEGHLIKGSIALCLLLILVLIVFVMPDLGLHPVEELERMESSHRPSIYHHVGEHAADAAAGAAEAGAEAHGAAADAHGAAAAGAH